MAVTAPADLHAAETESELEKSGCKLGMLFAVHASLREHVTRLDTFPWSMKS
jgi:hypothetical protein